MNKLSPNIINLLNTTRVITPVDNVEATHLQDALEWLASGVNVYRIEKPDKPPKHLVAYFAVIDPEHKSLLLGDHIKAQLWLPSGGHVDVNEDPKDTVIREMREELNQEAIFLRNNEKPFFITVTKTVGLTAGHTDVSLWYLLKGSIHDRLNFDRAEFTDMTWFSFDEILEASPVIFDPHMQRFVRKLDEYLSTVNLRQ